MRFFWADLSTHDILALSGQSLCVFSEGMPAFCASHELGWRFVSSSRLHLPDVDQVVSAFWAFDFESGQSIHFLVFFTYYCHWLLGVVYELVYFRSNFPWPLLFVVTFGACKNYLDIFANFDFLELETGAAFRTKLHIQNVLFIIYPRLDLRPHEKGQTRYKPFLTRVELLVYFRVFRGISNSLCSSFREIITDNETIFWGRRVMLHFFVFDFFVHGNA